MLDFASFKLDVINSINNKNPNSEAFPKLHEFQKEIYKTKTLPAPYVSETNSFLNDFSVKVISFILNTGVKNENEKKLADIFGKTLKRYAKIFISLITDPLENFFEVSIRIFDIQCLFYSSTATSTFFGNFQESPYYSTNISLLKSGKILDKISIYFNNSQKPLFKIFYLFLHFLQIIENNFSQMSIKQCFETCSLKIINFCDKLEGNDLRDVDEKYVNATLFLLKSLPQFSNSESISMTIIKTNIKFAKSAFLNKRFAGLSTLRSFLNKNPNSRQVTYSMILKEQVLESILKDFHHELVNDFVAILIEMIRQINNEVDIMKQFWEISLNQHSSTIDTFFHGWIDLIRNLTENYKEILFDLICQTQNYPDSCLEFMQSIVYLTNDDQRIRIFNALEQFYMANTSPKSSQDLLIKTICSYLPYNDVFRQSVLEKALHMIENGDHLQLALNLMMASSSRINSDQANKLIDMAIAHLTKESALQFLGFIQRIAFQMNNHFSKNQFDKICELTLDYFKSDDLNVVNCVCDFYTKLLTMYNKVLTCDMMKQLFDILCNLDSINPMIFNLIKHLFNYYDMYTHDQRTTKHDVDALEQLWKLLFRTQRGEIYMFLTKIESTQSYIEKCMQNYKTVIALRALYYFINAIEDGINKDLLNIQHNLYIDPEDMVTVQITGEIFQSLLLPKNLNYDSLFHRIAQLMNKKCDLLTFEEDGRIVYEKDQKIKDGMTINVRYSAGFSKSLSDKIDLSKLPTRILMDEKYSSKLYELLDDETLGPFALKILNEIPTIEKEKIVFKANQNELTKNQDQLTLNHTQELIEKDQLNQNNESNDNQIQLNPNEAIIQCENQDNEQIGNPISKELNNNIQQKNENDDQQINQKEYEFDWDQYLTKSNLFILNYRLNIIANNISQNTAEWMNNFFKTGGAIKLLNLALSDETYRDLIEIHLKDTDNHNLKSNLVLYLLLLRVSRKILESDMFQASEAIKQFASEKVSIFCKLIVKVGSDNLGFMILSNLLYMLKALTDCISLPASEFENFVSLIELTLFSPFEKIRKTIFEIMQKVPPTTYQYVLLPLLPKAFKMECVDCFTLLYRVAEETTDPVTIWNKLLDIVFSDFVPSNSLSVLDQLKFSIPSSTLSSALFKVLNVLVTKLDEIPRISELFTFLVNEIFLNTMKYFEISKEFTDLLINLLSKQPSLANSVINHLKEIRERMKEIKIDQDFRPIMSSTAKYRGLRNLGATCYMDSLLQQLFAIPIFRNAVLSADISDNEDDKWFLELQYLFLKMLLFPSCDVDPSSFVKCWKGWDDKPINPREQQDAIEFLQMFLDRIEEKVSITKSLFKGIILHHTDGIGYDFHQDINEEFVNIPLEVKNHKNITESFETYCSPDRFDGQNQYRTDEFGLIDAIQTHRILRPSPQLVITLKRFEYNLSTMVREKVNSTYVFPTDLDISTIMVDKSNSVKYELYGVVIHIGSALGGHYISHIKEDDGKWYIFNDRNVSSESLNAMLSDSYGGLSTSRIWDEQSQSYITTTFEKGSAYLLFYRKCDYNFNSEIDTIQPILLDRLLKDIQNEILKKLESSQEYLRFISQICVDTSFLLSFFEDPYFPINNLSLLSSQCIDNCQKNQEFAKEVLKNVDEHVSIILSAAPQEAKELYTSILCAAMDSASIDDSQSLIDTFLIKIRDDSELVQKNYTAIPQIFIVFDYYYKRVHEEKNVDKMVQIWINTFNDFILKCFKIEEIRENGDFSSVFDIYSLMIRDDVNRADLFLPILSKASINTFMSSPINSISFTNLLVLLLKHKSLSISDVLSVLNVNDNSSVCARCFICALANRNNCASDQIKEFVNFCNNKNQQYISAFLKNVSYLANQFKDDTALSFISLSDLWIETWLLSSSSEIRESIVKVFDSFSGNSNLTIYNCIYRALINNLENLKTNVISILKQYDQLKLRFEEAREQIPTNEYFKLFKWTVRNGHLYEAISKTGKEFGQLCSAFGKYNLVLPNMHLLDFVYESVRFDSFFDGESLHLFLNGLSNLYYRDQVLMENTALIAKFIKIIPDCLAEDLFTSKFFQRVIRNFLIGNPGEIIKNKILKNLDKLQKPENFGKILFQAVQMITPSFNELLHISWKTLEKIPKLSDLFLSEGCRDYLVDALLQRMMNLRIINRFSQNTAQYINKYELKQRNENPALYTVRINQPNFEYELHIFPILKTLGVFNRAYAIHNKNTSNFIYGNYVTWLANQWVKQSIQYELIFQIAMSSTKVILGASGPFVFLESLINFPGSKFVTEIYKIAVCYHMKISNAKCNIQPGLVFKTPVKGRKAAARFVVSLYEKIIELQKPVNQLTIATFLIDEFSTSIQNYVNKKDELDNYRVHPDVLEILARKVAQIVDALPNDIIKQVVIDVNFIFSTTNDPLMLNNGMIQLAMALFTNQTKRVDINAWMKNVCRILSATLNAILKNNQLSFEPAEELLIMNVINFIVIILNRTEIKKPEFLLSNSDLMKVCDILKMNQSSVSKEIINLIERSLK